MEALFDGSLGTGTLLLLDDVFSELDPRRAAALVVGLVETHGRAETEAMARDLPRLPLKAVLTLPRGPSRMCFSIRRPMPGAR